MVLVGRQQATHFQPSQKLALSSQLSPESIVRSDGAFLTVGYSASLALRSRSFSCRAGGRSGRGGLSKKARGGASSRRACPATACGRRCGLPLRRWRRVAGASSLSSLPADAPSPACDPSSSGSRRACSAARPRTAPSGCAGPRSCPSTPPGQSHRSRGTGAAPAGEGRRGALSNLAGIQGRFLVGHPSRQRGRRVGETPAGLSRPLWTCLWIDWAGNAGSHRPFVWGLSFSACGGGRLPNEVQGKLRSALAESSDATSKLC